MAQPTGLVDGSIFDHLQSKIDEDIKVRDQLRDILNDLEKQGSMGSRPATRRNGPSDELQAEWRNR